MSQAARDRFPPQIKYIIGNEAAERYSFYGMKSVLTLFMTQTLLFQASDAQAVFHLFTFGVYFTPLIGGYISDRFWGKYRTIMSLSVLYMAGHAVLAVWESTEGLYVGLTLIAFGAGGIKPCVSAHVGDQFSERNKHLVPRVFGLFYFSINLGSFVASYLTPLTREWFGASVAFGVPGVLMAIAVLVFWLGRHHYVSVPPAGKRKDAPLKVLWLSARQGRDAARRELGDGAVDAALSVVRVAVLLLPVMVFWALFDQTGSSWVLQATRMELHGLQPDQLQALNPLLVMIMIPVFSLWLYPRLERAGLPMTPLRRMTVGMYLTACSFVAAAIIEYFVDSVAVTRLFVSHLLYLVDQGVPAADLARVYQEFFSQPLQRVSVLWQFVPYVILTAGEVMVSITGLEFAYTQAPRTVKSTVMSFWLMTVALGNLLTAVISGLNVFRGPSYFLFWALLMTMVAGVFAALAARYRVVDYIEPDRT
jgi:proton-dependent oligopeptide transporter, POT family